MTRQPCSCLHLDFAGPFQGKVFLILVNSYSKWLEVISIVSMTSPAIVKALQCSFGTHGLPDTIVTDNGAQFTSTVFQAFMEASLIGHITSALFHTSTNSRVEWMIQDY